MRIHILGRKVKKQAQINEPVFFPYDKLILFVRAILHARKNHIISIVAVV